MKQEFLSSSCRRGVYLTRGGRTWATVFGFPRRLSAAMNVDEVGWTPAVLFAITCTPVNCDCFATVRPLQSCWSVDSVLFPEIHERFFFFSFFPFSSLFRDEVVGRSETKNSLFFFLNRGTCRWLDLGMNVFTGSLSRENVTWSHNFFKTSTF